MMFNQIPDSQCPKVPQPSKAGRKKLEKKTREKDTEMIQSTNFKHPQPHKVYGFGLRV